MQKEIELKCLCDGLLDALREMGLGKYSLRNYYYEGMWPLIKAYRKAGKELYDPVFTNEVVLGIQKQFQEGLVGNHISMHVRTRPLLILLSGGFMMTTEKHILDSQHVAPPLPDNIGISQPSGLDRLSRHPDKRSMVLRVKLTSSSTPSPCGPFLSSRPIIEPCST